MKKETNTMSENQKQGQEVQDVQIYDVKTKTWVRGYRKDVSKLPVVYEVTWTNCTTTDKAPDGQDLEIDVEKAGEILIQADSTATLSTGTSIDINVESTPDGTTWDSTPYAEMNIGDAEVKTMLVAPGPQKIRLRLDYNSGGTRADVTVKVKVRE
jgi:hypothetical protein